MKQLPGQDLFLPEHAARQEGFRLILGLDEAGRGPLAGPVVAAAVALRTDRFHSPIRDSKTLTEKSRERAFVEILEKAHVGVGVMNEAVIDEVNILEATFLAMTAAVRELVSRMTPADLPDARRVCLLVDGNRFRTDLPYAFRTIVRGDAKCFSIACASIVAKVTRDRMLKSYDRVFPQYGFSRHKGYATGQHREAIRRHGPSIIHRKTFHPSLREPSASARRAPFSGPS